MRISDLMEVTRPQERYEATEVLRRAGYHMMGSGCFATLYGRQDKNYVLKLFDSDDHAYNAFIDLVRQHPNEHFPKLRGRSVPVSKKYNAIKMEILTPYRGDPQLFNVYLRERFRTPDQRSSQWYDAEELFHEKPSLREALDLLQDNLYPAYRFDLKQDNLMMRGSTVVFTDPVANHFSQDQRVPHPMLDDPEQIKRADTRTPDRRRLDAILDDELLNDLMN